MDDGLGGMLAGARFPGLMSGTPHGSSQPEQKDARATPLRAPRGTRRRRQEQAALIREDPEGGPMFPVVKRPNGAAEAVCHMQGHLAGRLASADKRSDGKNS